MSTAVDNEAKNSVAATVQQAYESIQKDNGVIVDVRGFDEFAAGHADPSVCIPLPDLERRAGEISTQAPVFLICATGVRSAVGVERLRALGIQNVSSIQGGFSAWSYAKLPSVVQKGIIPLEQQVRGVAGTLVFIFAVLGLTVNRWFNVGAIFVGFMLFLSSVTGFCPMISILKVLPWNKVAQPPAR